ncbi:hypothetical protein FA13DRAFT_1716382 [Coprinellus micaceus]|uniref:Uncharacterized protein n=1 Tax=Coprinellus micaceus TaxID=71717 RepID=A0A4Y7SJH8_COPMI|nr:hypothetical protein FA13DRAFT_1716382 [Coprinellus micaceus]
MPRDYIAHLMGISGCRITPGPRGEGPHQVAYFQMYVTDKSLTAARENGHYAKHITGPQALRNHDSASRFFMGLLSLYRSANNANACSARVELRVPLEHALSVLIEFDGEVIADSLIALEPSVYWGWKEWSVEALRLVWELGFDGGRFKSAIPNAVLVNMAVPWLLNSIQATIDTKSASRSLMRAILPLSRGDEVMQDEHLLYPTPLSNPDGDPLRVPAAVRGAIFIRLIEQDETGTPLFPGARFVDDDACRTLLNDCLPNILQSITLGRSNGRRRDPTRIRNKIKQRPLPPPNEGGPPSIDIELPNLQALTIGPADDNGHITPTALFNNTTFSAEVSSILRQFAPDLMNVSPNARDIEFGSVCRLTEAEREDLTIDIFQERNLASILNTCRWMRASSDMWRFVFDKLFPAKGKQVEAQNFSRAVYYNAWASLTNSADEETVETIRTTLYTSIFKHLFWLPHAKCDRIWETRDRNRTQVFHQFPPQKPNLPTVNILINGNLDPKWEITAV